MAHYNGADVGCGRCIACRINTTRDWALRLTHESESYGWHNCSFLTFTLDDRHCDGSTHIDDLSNFFDDIKKVAGKNFKRLGVSEYGFERDRPHYHAVCFGLGTEQADLVQKNWPKGFTSTLPFIGQATGNYVAGYVLKKIYGDEAKESYGTREHPTLRCSNGIGKEWCEKHAKEIIAEGLIYDNYGQAHRVPRYYRKLLDMDMTQYVEEREEIILKHNEKLVRRTGPVRIAQMLKYQHDLMDRIIKNKDWIGYYNLMYHLASVEQKKVARQRQLNTLATLRRR